MTPWLPLYLLLLLVATLSPMLGVCETPRIFATPSLTDALGNLAIFAPLGLAMRRHSFGLLFLVALALSTGIEAVQLLLPRATSVLDVAANTASALIGRALAPRIPPIRFRASRAIGALALVAAALGSAWIAIARPSIGPNDLSNWELFPLVIGNEAIGDRQWRGTIAELWVYDRALEAEQIPGITEGTLAPWSQGGPVLWMRFMGPALARIDGPDGSSDFAAQPPSDQAMALGPEGLRIREGRWQLPDFVARHVYSRLRETDQFTVAARARPQDLTLRGPARILSLSADSQHRDFTLGQQLGNAVLRVRTPQTGLNGTLPPVWTFDEPLTREFQTLVASFQGERARIDIDGSCRVERFYPGMHGPYPLTEGIATSVVTLTALAGLGGALLAGARRWRRILALIAAGGSMWALLWALGTWSHLSGFAPIAPALGLATLAASVPIAWRDSIASRISR